jgi:Calx-beta domain
VVEGDAGLTSLDFELALSAPSGKPVSARFETADGTATSPADYQAAAATYTLAPGETVLPARVNVVGDLMSEPREWITARLTAAVNAVITGSDGTAVGLGVIEDDDLSAFYAVAPCRLLDTRLTAAPLGANTIRELVLAGGPCGVPADAGALLLNVTAVAPTDSGNLRLFPAGQPPPQASVLNFTAGRTRANNAVALAGAGGKVWVKCDMPAGSAGSVHLVLDLYGYFR